MIDTPTIAVRHLGLVEYLPTYQAMIERVDQRSRGSARNHQADEFWVLQHYPVFTLGKAGKRLHVLAPGDIPVIETDRGGQVTYHGPGQAIVYVMLDLKRSGLGPRGLVKQLENAVIESLAAHKLNAVRRAGAPGVYVDDKKIASLGLRIKGGISYHGLAVNIENDLEPFSRINPCGYAGLEVTRLTDHVSIDCETYTTQLLNCLIRQFHSSPTQRLAS